MNTPNANDDDTTKKALNRVKKLLRLARDRAATPAEAAAAMAKAAAIAGEHGIEHDSIDTGGDSHQPGTGPLSHAKVKTDSGPAARMAVTLIQDQFGCRAIFAGKELVIVGPGAFVHVAGYAFTYIRRSMLAAWRHRPDKRVRNRRCFLAGYAGAIERDMPDNFRNHTIIPDDKFESYLQESVWPGQSLRLSDVPQRKIKKWSGKAAWAGFQAGNRNSIRGALPAAASR